MLAKSTGTTGVRVIETENTASSVQTMQSLICTVLRSEIGRNRKNNMARISSASSRKNMGISLETAGEDDAALPARMWTVSHT